MLLSNAIDEPEYLKGLQLFSEALIDKTHGESFPSDSAKHCKILSL
jgi:hypothetical protein